VLLDPELRLVLVFLDAQPALAALVAPLGADELALGFLVAGSLYEEAEPHARHADAGSQHRPDEEVVADRVALSRQYQKAADDDEHERDPGADQGPQARDRHAHV